MTSLDVVIHNVETLEEALECKRWVSQNHEYLAIDTETGGLDWWREKPRLFQIGNAHEAWTMDWNTWGAGIAEIFNNYHGDLIFFNAKFDVTMMEHWSEGRIKVPRHKVKDVAIMANVMDPSRPTALKRLAETHVDRQAARSQRILDEAMQANGWTWATVPVDFQPYWLYGGLDCILTSRLYDKFYPEVMIDAPASYELEMGTIWALMDMERKGIEVDIDFTKKRYNEFVDYVDQCNKWCMDAYGFSPGSKPQVIAQISKDTNYKFTVKTDGDGPPGSQKGKSLKLDKEILEDVIYHTQHPLAITEKTRRRVEKMASTYLDTFLTYNNNGRLHPSFNQLNKQDNNSKKYGAVTGRMTVKNPALQTLPRRSDDDTPEAQAANAIRSCLTATNGGESHKLLLCDFDQFEQRIQASYSGDVKLRSLFAEADAGGPDYFTLLARDIYQDPTLQKSDPRRTSTKNTIYAEGYGAGIPKLAMTAGVSIDEMKQFMATFGHAYPQRKKWSEDLIKLAEQRYDTEGTAYIRSPLTGRKLPALYRDKAYTLVNYFVQGTQAEALKMKTLELRKAGIDDIVLLVHDEVISDIPNEDIEEASHIITETMNDNEMFEGIHLTAGLDIVERWGGQSK